MIGEDSQKDPAFQDETTQNAARTEASEARHISNAPTAYETTGFSAKEQLDTEVAGKGRRRAAIIGGGVIALAAIAIVIMFSIAGIGKNSLLNASDYDTASLKVHDEAESSDGGRTVTFKGETYRLNENIVPLCIMGNDKGLHTPSKGTNGQADAIMVVAVDTSTGDIKGISIPRDSMVPSLEKFKDIYEKTSYKTDKMQICLAYACGSDDDESSKLVAAAASDLLYGIPINLYYTLETDGLGELADLADGVTLKALYTVPVTRYSSKMPIKAGETVTLRGKDALRYIQYRDTKRYETAIERLERQRQFVSALSKKLIEQVKGNPSLAVDIYNTLQDYSVTNIGSTEFGYIASLITSSNMSDLKTTKLEGEAVHNSDNPWEQYIVDDESAYQTVLDVFYCKAS